jgi:alpha-mannosidase
VAAAEAALLGQMASPVECVAVFNALGWERPGVVALPWSERLAGRALAGPGGAPLAAQVVETAGQKQVLLETPAIPSLGYAAVPLVPAAEAGAEAANTLAIGPERLESGYYLIELNDRGQMTRLWDKRQGHLTPGTSTCSTRRSARW